VQEFIHPNLLDILRKSLKTKPFETVILVPNQTLKSVVLDTLLSLPKISVLPEIIPLTDLDEIPFLRNHSLTTLLIDDLIENQKYSIQNYYDYLQHAGARKRLLTSFSFFYDNRITPKSSMWATPLYKQFIERYKKKLPSQSKIAPIYFKNKNCVFLGFENEHPRVEIIIEKCIFHAASSSIQISQQSSMLAFMNRLQLKFTEHLTFPLSESPLKGNLDVYSFPTEDEEIVSIQKIANTIRTPLTILCPSDSFSRALIKRFHDAGIETTDTRQKPALKSSLFQFLHHTLTLIETSLSIHSFSRFFAHSLSHNFLKNNTSAHIRSDIMVHLLQHFEKVESDSWMKAFEEAHKNFKTYLTSSYIEEKSYFKKELSVFIEALNQLKFIETQLQLCLKSPSPLLFKKNIHAFLSLFITQHLEEHPDVDMINDWMTLKSYLSEFVEIYEDTIGNTFQLTPFVKRFKQALELHTLPNKQQQKSPISVMIWNSVPLKINQTLIIAGFTHTSWNSNSPENEFIPEELYSRFQATTSRNSDDNLFLLLRLCSQNTTIITSSKKNQQGYLLPHRFMTTLRSCFTLNDCIISYSPPPRTKNNYTSLAPNKSLIFKEPASKNILEKTITSLPFSSSQLETFQNCPYHYFLSYLLNYVSPNDIKEGISGAEWGSLLHDMIHQSYIELENQHITSAMDARFETTILKTSKSCFNAYRKDSLFWDVKELLCFGQKGQKGILQHYIDLETETPTRLTPTLLEHKLQHSLFLSKSISITVRGVIDCVLTNAISLAVLDYKSGATIPTYKDIETYRSLQLSLYMLLLKYSFPDKELCGGVYVRLNAKHHDKKVMLTTESAKKEIFSLTREKPFIFDEDHWEGLIHRLKVIVTLIKNGVFTPEPLDELASMASKRKTVCGYCSYKSYCRYKERYSSWA
jgi:hypothetical protein